ncbi:MAG: DNA repair protein RecO [Candidatus ainarchaeum sp.]|nr:DNA repair protein RecO [Candidatus ainarchaeum sp.]
MIKTKAIVLSRRDCNDYDSLISCYSLDFGKICLLAKGLKRPKAKLVGHLEPLNIIDLMIIKGRERDYIGSAISEDSFLNIKRNYYLIDIAGRGINFLNGLIFQNQADYNIFLILKDFLTELNNLKDEDREAEIYLIFFQLRLLDILGYDFDFSHCSVCNKESIYFNFFDKEVLCQDCLKTKNVSMTKIMKIDRSIINFKKEILQSNFKDLKKMTVKDGDLKKMNELIEIIRKIV